jgi:hypothetical protein
MSEAAEPAPATRDAAWTWVWHRMRPWVGWLLVLLGGVALFLGWYGVSGEALTAKQLPYLVSGGLTGVGLLVLGGFFIATDDIRRELTRVDDLQQKVDELHALFVTELAAEPTVDTGTPASSGDGWVAVPNGVTFHRPDCALVAGKTEAAAVDPAVVPRRRLRPCRVCDPGTIT